MEQQHSESQEIKCKARIRVRALSDMGIALYALYVISLLVAVVMIVRYEASAATSSLEVSFWGYPLLSVSFDRSMEATLEVYKEHMVLILLVFSLLAALPAALFALFKKTYDNELTLTETCLYFSAKGLRAGNYTTIQIPVEKLDSIVIRRELLLNGDTIILRSPLGRIRIHCATNGNEFVRTTMHYYFKYTGHRDILTDRRADHAHHSHHTV